MIENIIEVKNLCRTFKVNKTELEVIKNVSFNIKKGEIFALLGPNGAGKSTIIKILTTLLSPTSGQVNLLEYDANKESKKIREKINFVFGGEAGLYWRLTGRENLMYFADLYKVPRKKAKKEIEDILHTVELTDYADRKVEQYSKGMKQRLLIARGLINNPEILFLDEPTIGLDPIGALALRKIIKKLNNDGKTILLTTHYMEDVEVLCNRLAFINKGKLIDVGTKQELLSKYLDNSSATIEELYFKLINK